MSISKVFNIEEKVLFDAELSVTDIRVFIITRLEVLAADRLGKPFCPENISYATKIGIHPRRLQKSFEKLEKKGYLLREMKGGKRFIYV